jgi:hypothetical protein
MLLTFTEASSKEAIAINPTAVNAVFKAPQGEMQGKTVVAIGAQPVVVEEDYLEVVGQINGALA